MSNEKIFYDRDANLNYLEGKTIGIIGYGIQGRAQALNLRDSGFKVLVANRSDSYMEQTLEDKMEVVSFETLAQKSDVIMMLIPDQAHKEVVEKYLTPFFRPGQMLVVAHGYSLRFNKFEYPSFIDVALLAPRMPGKQIRREYQNGHGVPAFVDVVQDATKNAWEKILALAKAISFTKAGVLHVDYKVETELDLFCEQYLVANIVKTIRESFDILVNKHNYPPIATLMELYASSEMGEVLILAAKAGIGRAFQQNASPTCQFGISENYFTALTKSQPESIDKIINEIKDGSFDRKLETEGANGYPQVEALWKHVNSEQLLNSQEWINKNINNKI